MNRMKRFKSLKEENKKLHSEVEACRKEIVIQDQKEPQDECAGRLSDRESQQENKIERFSQILTADDLGTEEIKQFLIEKIMNGEGNKLKQEMMEFYESSDDEPELTQK